VYVRRLAYVFGDLHVCADIGAKICRSACMVGYWHGHSKIGVEIWRFISVFGNSLGCLTIEVAFGHSRANLEIIVNVRKLGWKLKD
jgi:hypothetical protein